MQVNEEIDCGTSGIILINFQIYQMLAQILTSFFSAKHISYWKGVIQEFNSLLLYLYPFSGVKGLHQSRVIAFLDRWWTLRGWTRFVLRDLLIARVPEKRRCDWLVGGRPLRDPEEIVAELPGTIRRGGHLHPQSVLGRALHRLTHELESSQKFARPIPNIDRFRNPETTIQKLFSTESATLVDRFRN